MVQVCSVPPTISICLNKGNLTHEFVKHSQVFTVSILTQDTSLGFIGKFGFKSGRETDKFIGTNYKTAQTGAPIVMDNALAYLEARVISEADAGTHAIFIGEVIVAEIIKEGKPLTYAYYQQVKKGFTPKAAPNYIEKEKRGYEDR